VVGDLGYTLIDLSNATRIKSTAPVCVTLDGQWVTVALETFTPEHRDLQQVSIHAPHGATLDYVCANVRRTIGETAHG